MKKPKPKPTKLWIPIAACAVPMLSICIGFPLLMGYGYKPKPEVITKEVKVTAPFGEADFMAFIESLPDCATKRNLQIVIASDLNESSEELFRILQAYAQMKIAEAEGKTKAD